MTDETEELLFPSPLVRRTDFDAKASSLMATTTSTRQRARLSRSRASLTVPLLSFVAVTQIVCLLIFWFRSLPTTTTSRTATKPYHHVNMSLIQNVSREHITTTVAPKTTKPRFEIVTTILYDDGQHTKAKGSERADWLMTPEIEDIPVTIMSPDQLLKFHANGSSVLFYPEADHVFGHLLSHSNTSNHIRNHNSNNKMKKRPGKVTIFPIVNGYLASEVPGYLLYILTNWESLPDVLILLHGTPTAHGVNIFKHIRHVIDHWTVPQIGLLTINEVIRACRPNRRHWDTQWKLLGLNPQYMPGRTMVTASAQFMVTKERIYLRPKWFYQQALKLAYEFHDAVFFEHYWHIIWGEQAIISSDRELQNYVHSNWTRTVHDAVLHNPYPNVPCAEIMCPWLEQSMADPKSYYTVVNHSKSVCPPGYQYYFQPGKKWEYWDPSQQQK